MSSLHKDPRNRSPYWYCAYTLPNGRRTLKSTKQTDHAKACEICLKWERAAKRARTGDFTEPQSRKVLNEILEISGQGPMNLATVEQFFNEWLASKKSAKAGGTARRYTNVITPFLASLGQRRKVNIASLTTRDIQRYFDAQLAAGLANKTVNFVLKVLRTVLNAARRQGLILTNPAEAIETLPDNSAERGTFTDDEVKSLLTAADVEWRGVIHSPRSLHAGRGFAVISAFWFAGSRQQ